MNASYFHWLPVDLQEQILERLEPVSVNNLHRADCISKEVHDRFMLPAHEQQCREQGWVIGELQCPDYYAAFTKLEAIIDDGLSEDASEDVQLYLLSLLDTPSKNSIVINVFYQHTMDSEGSTSRVISKMLSLSALRYTWEAYDMLVDIISRHPFHPDILPTLERLRIPWEERLSLLIQADNFYLIRGLSTSWKGSQPIRERQLKTIFYHTKFGHPRVAAKTLRLMLDYFEFSWGDLSWWVMSLDCQELLPQVLKPPGADTWTAFMAMLRRSTAVKTLSPAMAKELVLHLELHLKAMPTGPRIDADYLSTIQAFCLLHWSSNPVFSRVFRLAAQRSVAIETLDFFQRDLPSEMRDAIIFRLDAEKWRKKRMYENFYDNNSVLAQPVEILKRLTELRPEIFERVKLKVSKMDEEIWWEVIMSDCLRKIYGMAFLRFHLDCPKLMSLALRHDDLPWARCFTSLCQTVTVSGHEEVLELMRASKYYPKEGIELPEK